MIKNIFTNSGRIWLWEKRREKDKKREKFYSLYYEAFDI